MSHSPGPWRWNNPRGGDAGRIIASDGDIVVTDMGMSREAGNSRLIAAAPEMLELLRGWHGGSLHQCSEACPTRQLLARIDGEP